MSIVRMTLHILSAMELKNDEDDKTRMNALLFYICNKGPAIFI